VVDDEPDIVAIVTRYLERDGHSVSSAADGLTARARLPEGFDLVIFDVMLPGLDGFELVTAARQLGPVPILMLSARDEEADRVLGLELGADDYLTKPFSPRELAARVKALLRRASMPSASSTQRSGLIIDAQARRVTWMGELLELTPREYDLLRVLAHTPGKTFTRDELLDRLWGREYAGDSRRVDLHISNLREKLTRAGGTSPLRSVWGVGYRFEP
jgi:DNA-binding response OmpR family regulator